MGQQLSAGGELAWTGANLLWLLATGLVFMVTGWGMSRLRRH